MLAWTAEQWNVAPPTHTHTCAYSAAWPENPPCMLPGLPARPPCLPRPQRRMAEVLESREAHYAVIGMVLLDLALVLTELVLSSFYPAPDLAPHLGG